MVNHQRRSVTHVITGLETGGAEMLLLRLLPHLRDLGIDAEIVSLLGIGTVGQQIEQLGFRVRSLDMSRRLPSPLAIPRLAGWLRQSRPTAVQTWLYHADLIGGAAARIAGVGPVVWGLHVSRIDATHLSPLTRLVAWSCARSAAILPRRIVCCSQSAFDAHRSFGYPADRMIVIPNGIDTDLFVPDPSHRRSVRSELGLADDALLIGMAARFDPVKHHESLIAAAQISSRDVDGLGERIHLVLCGAGVDASNRALAGWIDAAGLGGRVHLLGHRDDMPRIIAALDVATLSSHSEASPLVIAEAMSCGVPAVATDVGDCAQIIGDTGQVVPAARPAALAGAWHALLGEADADRRRRSRAARERILAAYGVSTAAQRYAALYESLATDEEIPP